MRLRSYSWTPHSSEQGAEWLAIHSPLFTSSEPAFVDPKSAYRMWAGKSFILAHTSCNRTSLVHNPSATPPIDHVGICLVMSGTIGILSDRGQARAVAGDIVLFDLQGSMELIRGSEGAITSELNLWIPRARLPSAFSQAMGSARHIIRSASTGTAVVTAAIEALLAQVKRATASEMDEIVVGVLALAAKVMGLSAEELSEMNRTSVSGPLESFTTISRFIEANLVSRDLSVAKISSTFGLSRATLYRLFEPVGGVACYIRSRRLVRARNDPDRTDCLAGFQSIAAFNRAFS